MSIIPSDSNIFIIDLEYCVPLTQVEPLIPAHITFLEKYYERGVFLASGAKVPREGGVILAISKSKEVVQNLIKQDPFYVAGVAKYSITEFTPSNKAKELF